MCTIRTVTHRASVSPATARETAQTRECARGVSLYRLPRRAGDRGRHHPWASHDRQFRRRGGRSGRLAAHRWRTAGKAQQGQPWGRAIPVDGQRNGADNGEHPRRLPLAGAGGTLVWLTKHCSRGPPKCTSAATELRTRCTYAHM